MADQIAMKVGLIVKAPSKEEAETIIAKRLNAWFMDPKEEMVPNEGYPYGALLHWNIIQGKGGKK